MSEKKLNKFVGVLLAFTVMFLLARLVFANATKSIINPNPEAVILVGEMMTLNWDISTENLQDALEEFAAAKRLNADK